MRESPAIDLETQCRCGHKRGMHAAGGGYCSSCGCHRFTTEPKAAVDPNYILSQEEFHNSLNASELRTSLRTEGFIRRELREAEMAFGWILLSVAFFLFLLGYYALKGELRP